MSQWNEYSEMEVHAIIREYINRARNSSMNYRYFHRQAIPFHRLVVMPCESTVPRANWKLLSSSVLLGCTIPHCSEQYRHIRL